jgi:hypothetical protein
MKSNDKSYDKSRRKFLGFSLLLGAGILAPPVPANGEAVAVHQEKIRLITADGQVVEVEKRRILGANRKKPATDEELKEWLDREGD